MYVKKCQVVLHHRSKCTLKIKMKNSGPTKNKNDYNFNNRNMTQKKEQWLKCITIP
ncbi:hypothetical protein Hanom_Chr13g01218521 [Helianthus anomalus]